jgi:pimeloyl-ACP methyl ester carboxylesterase
MLDYAPALHQRYNLVLIDLRNSGRSGGAESTGGVLERYDLRAMLDWLAREKKPVWIAVVGNSNGAATALAEAVDDPRVRALVLDSMHASVERQLGNIVVTEHAPAPAWPLAPAIVAGVSARIGEDLASVDPARMLEQLRNRPVLLTHGTADLVDRPADSLDVNVTVAQAAGINVRVERCAGAGHGQVVVVCRADWERWVLGFLADHGGLPAPS